VPIRWFTLALSLMVGPAFTGAVAAQDAAARGAELSAEWCAPCHHIAPGGAMKEEPPSFAAIAVYRTPDQMRAAMVAPHLGMPPLVEILGLEAEDLIAYIVSLESTATLEPTAN
jgi:mono/diheme cytochrome c family protein